MHSSLRLLLSLALFAGTSNAIYVEQYQAIQAGCTGTPSVRASVELGVCTRYCVTPDACIGYSKTSQTDTGDYSWQMCSDSTCGSCQPSGSSGALNSCIDMTAWHIKVSDTAADAYSKLVCTTTGCTADSGSSSGGSSSGHSHSPAEPNYVANFVIELIGLLSGDWDSATEVSFKTLITNAMGSICGADGSSACTSTDVTVSGVSRRDASVTYSVKAYSAGAAETAETALTTYMGTDAFVADLQAAGSNLASVTGASVTSTSTSSAGGNSSSSDTTTIVAVCVVLGVVLVGVAVVVAVVMIRRRSAEESQPQTVTNVEGEVDLESQTNKEELEEPLSPSKMQPPANAAPVWGDCIETQRQSERSEAQIAQLHRNHNSKSRCHHPRSLTTTAG